MLGELLDELVRKTHVVTGWWVHNVTKSNHKVQRLVDKKDLFA